MKTKLSILAMLLAAPLAASAAAPDSSEYTLPVHIRQTELTYACNSSFLGNPSSCGMRLLITAVVEGQKLYLRANTSLLIRTGDYKAKAKKDEGESGPHYVDQRAYDLLMPDGKVLTFQVVGESQD